MEIHIYTLSLILFAHWVADFFLQTHHMATNKSKCNIALASHVGTYGFVFFVISLSLFPNCLINGFLWVAINMLAHFATDYVTSRASSALYKEQRFHEFFVVIGLDQFVHAITLCGTYLMLNNA